MLVHIVSQGLQHVLPGPGPEAQWQRQYRFGPDLIPDTTKQQPQATATANTTTTTNTATTAHTT